MDIGDKIKELRQMEGMSQKQLAQLAGVSVGLISRIEKNGSKPSLPLLINLSFIFGKDINYFILSPKERPELQPIIISKDKRPRYVCKKSKMSCEKLISYIEMSKLTSMIWHLDSGGPKGVKPHSHEGQEFGIVLKGNVQLTVGNQEYILHKGDSAYFHSLSPHMFKNIGKEPAEMIWFNTCSPELSS